MQLVLAEKPSVARDLARVLGVRPSGEHCFEGERFVITWAIGHLVELDEPAAYNPAWRAWRLENLPMLPEEFLLRASSHARAQLKAVSTLLRDRRFRGVINACDAGREGELIFRYVYQYARSTLPTQRLWVSSLTDEAIRRGFAALRAGAQLDPLADAARSRSEADWLVGMNATRAVTARGREAGHDALYSIGRVQTPTLAMLVAREQQIRAFVPRPYWEVKGDFKTGDGARFTAGWRSPQHDTRLATEALANELVARDRAVGEGIVSRTRSRTVREAPPLLFDLTSLQRTANRRYGFSAARTLELAQALYERHKVLTYPRTDSRHLSTDVIPELPPLFASLASIPDYAPFADVLVATPPTPSRRIVDDTKVGDHHAIIPTAKPARPQSLDRDEGRIYDLVVRRFLGAFFPDAEFAVTEAWIDVGSGAAAPPKFPDELPRPQTSPSAEPREPAILGALPPPPDRYLARGRARTVAGWQEVAGIGADASAAPPGEQPLPLLPPLTEGQRLPAAFSHTAKQTTPPPRYTEATLLGAMESAGKSMDDEALRAAMKDRGLGTPATRASIIETLLRRSYIVREKQALVPTGMGIALVESLPVASLASPELTGSWEARLARIARGEDSRASFMADIARYVAEMVDAIRVAPPPAAPPPGSAPPQQQAWGKGGKRGGRGRGRGGGGGKSNWSRRASGSGSGEGKSKWARKGSSSGEGASNWSRGESRGQSNGESRGQSNAPPRATSNGQSHATSNGQSHATSNGQSHATSNAPPRATSNGQSHATSNGPLRAPSNVPRPDMASRATSNAPRANGQSRAPSNAPRPDMAPRATSNAPPRATSNAPPSNGQSRAASNAPRPDMAPRATSNPPPRASTSTPKLGTAVGSTIDLACPSCRQATLMAGARGWGCARWREGCRFVVWFETAGRKLSAAQLRDLVTRGKTRRATFEPVRGAPQAGRLVLDVTAPSNVGAARFEPA